MIDTEAITEALFDILDAGLGADYTVKRNEQDNDSPDIAAQNSGWVNVWLDTENYEAYRTGNAPWRGDVALAVRLQAASMGSPAKAKEKMNALKKAVMEVVDANRKLNGTVSIINRYAVTHDIDDARPFFRKATMTIFAEVRT